MLFSFLWQLSTEGANRELLLTDRPYLPLNIQALEELFEDNDNDLKVLNPYHGVGPFQASVSKKIIALKPQYCSLNPAIWYRKSPINLHDE